MLYPSIDSLAILIIDPAANATTLSAMGANF